MRKSAVAAAVALSALSGSSVAAAAFPGVNGRTVVSTGAGEIFVGDTNVTNTPGDFDTEASWSPDGKHIAFSSSRASPNRQWRNIWVMDPSGANTKQLTSTGAGVYSNENPSWSPDGTKLVYTASTDTARELRVMNADGSGVHALTSGPSDAQARWSPDGAMIVFVRFTGGTGSDIWTVGADGSNAAALTTTPLPERSPSWSPDGREIAYGVIEAGEMARQAFFVRSLADASTARRIAPAALGSNPVWSPDGAWLGYLDGASATPMMVPVAGAPTPRAIPGATTAAWTLDWESAKVAPVALTGLPKTERCVAAGKAIALRVQRGAKVVKVTVKIAGRTVTRKGRQLSGPVVVKTPKKGAYVVKVTVTTTAGKTTQVTRRYRACVS